MMAAARPLEDTEARRGPRRSGGGLERGPLRRDRCVFDRHLAGEPIEECALEDPIPTGMLKLIGSYANVARMLDDIAAISRLLPSSMPCPFIAASIARLD